MKKKKSERVYDLPKIKKGIIFLAVALALFGSGTVKKAMAADTTGPELVSLSVEPKTIDTTNGSAQVTLTAHITDNQEGAAGACVSTGWPMDCNWSTSFMIKPDNVDQQRLSFGPTFKLVSGDAFDGIYTATVTLPQYSASGKWSIFSAQLADKLGNFTYLYKTDLETMFGAEAISTNNAATIEDITPPELVSLSLDKHEIDTTNGSAQVTLTARITDDQVGACVNTGWPIDCNWNTSFILISDNDGTQLFFSQPFQLISGNAVDGVYTTTVTIPQGSAGGNWSIGNSQLADKIGNFRQLSKSDLEAKFGAETSINNIATTSDIPDTTPPELVSFDFNPKTIDVSSGSQAVEFMLHLTDLSGVKKETYFAFKADNGVENGYDDTYIQSLYMAQLISGDDKDGIYKITVNFPENSATGNWRPYFLLLWDGSGNIKTISGEDVISYFENKDFPTVLEVKKSTYIFGGFLPPVAKDNKTFNSNGSVSVRFQLTDASGEYVSNAKASLMVDEKPAVANGNSNIGNEFRYDELADQYVFNLSLKKTSLGAGTHTLKIILDDGTTYGQDITIK